MAKILVVEDDVALADSLRSSLTDAGYFTESVNNAEDALMLFRSFSYDVLILDWDLPEMTGLDVCKKFRADGGTSTVLFLTGRNSLDDKEAGFRAGGDDYLTKPFAMRELLMRVEALLRRQRENYTLNLNIKGVELQTAKRNLIIDGTEYYLAPKESAILEFLMRNPNQAFSAEALLKSVWPSDDEATTSAVRTWMRFLRKKFETHGKNDFIKTLHGSGYIIEN